MPFVGVDVTNLPLIERLRFKSADAGEAETLSLSTVQASLEDVDDDFWASFDTLDRQALFDETRALLASTGSTISISEIAERLPPTHDLETIAFWLSLARQADLPFEQFVEAIDVSINENLALKFSLPRVELNFEALQGVHWET